MEKGRKVCIISIAIAAVVAIACGIGIALLIVFMPSPPSYNTSFKSGVYVSSGDCRGLFGAENVEIEISETEPTERGTAALAFLPDSRYVSVRLDGKAADIAVTYASHGDPSFGFELFGAAGSVKLVCVKTGAETLYVGERAAGNAVAFVWERA